MLIMIVIIAEITSIINTTVAADSFEQIAYEQLPDFQEEVDNILSYITPTMNDVEKALAVHEYFISNYSYGPTYPNGKLLRTEDSYTAYGIMVNKAGACEAYTQAYKYIMDKLGIPCIIVTSVAMDHAWNMICIDGEWYHVDVTWDDADEPGNARHVNFLRSDSGIAKTGHYGWDGNVTASSSKYDDAFWINTLSYISHIDGKWYYVDSGDITFQYDNGFTFINHSKASEDGLIKKYSFKTNTHETIYTVPLQTYTYKRKEKSYETTWKGSGTRIAVDNKKIYYNTNNKVYSINPNGTGNTLVCTVTLADAPASFDTGRGYIEGIEIHNGRIYYNNSEDDGYYLATALPDAVPTYTITVRSENGGYITPGAYTYSEGSIEILKNRSRTFKIAANDGFSIKDVLVDGVSVGAVSIYTFKNINSNHSIRAIFSINSVNTPGGEWELIVLDGEYYDIRSFSEGFAVAINSSYSQYGYINSSGKLVIPFTSDYKEVYDFENGLAQVYKDGKYGCINTSGILVIPCIYDHIGVFIDSMATVKKNGKYGFIDTYGEEVVPCIYENIRDFKNGIGWVYKDGKGKFIDTTGNEVPPPENADSYFKREYNLEEDLTDISKDGKYGLQKWSTGEIIVPCIYDYIDNFSEGLAAVQKDWKYGYINTKGEVVIPLIYDGAEEFCEGLASVRQDVKHGYINKSGELVVPCIYEDARAFSENKALVVINDKWAILKKASSGNSANGTDSDNPSSWAINEINTAVELNLVPYDMQNKYTANITRAEFCKLVISMLIVKTRQSINAILSKNGVSINRKAFSDTTDTAILAANALGIANGIGNNRFNPNGTITRQEAAAMLQRTAKVLGFVTPNATEVKFSDSSKFPGWAVEPIKFISSMVDKTTNKRVMGGTGNNHFSNTDTYTREQSYLTILRLFNAIN